MKDKWMNMGHEEDELKPFIEPTLDITDEKRIDLLVTMGYCRAEVQESLRTHKFDDCYASYLLLGRKSTEVSQSSPSSPRRHSSRFRATIEQNLSLKVLFGLSGRRRGPWRQRLLVRELKHSIKLG